MWKLAMHSLPFWSLTLRFTVVAADTRMLRSLAKDFNPYMNTLLRVLEDDPWEPGTRVYREYEDGWYLGVIVDLDEEAKTYEIVYEDSDMEIIGFDSFELDEYVSNAENYEAYPRGTPIVNTKSGQSGIIESLEDWVYTIQYDTGETATFTKFREVDAFVQAASQTDAPTEKETFETSEVATEETTGETTDEGTTVPTDETTEEETKTDAMVTDAPTDGETEDTATVSPTDEATEEGTAITTAESTQEGTIVDTFLDTEEGSQTLTEEATDMGTEPSNTLDGISNETYSDGRSSDTIKVFFLASSILLAVVVVSMLRRRRRTRVQLRGEQKDFVIAEYRDNLVELPPFQ